MATITSKMQLTLPAKVSRKLGIKQGEKVLVSEKRGRIIITSTKKMVEELAGSLEMPRKWKKKNLDQIIEEAKTSYFRKQK